MRTVIFTGDSIRHKYFANELGKLSDHTLIISEKKSSELSPEKYSDLAMKHFSKRDETEQKYFSGNQNFFYPTVCIPYKSVNSKIIYDQVKSFKPDLMFVFGSSIIKEPLLSLLPSGHFINLHLGLSPYYRGSGTNFWPFVNDELEFVGSTILHIDAGIDTGDMICHVRPKIILGDNVHTVGCRVIIDSVIELGEIIGITKKEKKLPRISQWEVANCRYYRRKDFSDEALLMYYENLKNGMIENYIKQRKKQIKLVTLINK